MSEAGKQLLEAAREGLAFCKGEAYPNTYEVHAPPAEIDVKAIRKGLNMTQQVFGERFGFGPARIRDWEQKRTRPAASDRVLLVTIKLAPEVVLHALETEATERIERAGGVVTARKQAIEPAGVPLTPATAKAPAGRSRP